MVEAIVGKALARVQCKCDVRVEARPEERPPARSSRVVDNHRPLLVLCAAIVTRSRLARCTARQIEGVRVSLSYARLAGVYIEAYWVQLVERKYIDGVVRVARPRGGGDVVDLAPGHQSNGSRTSELPWLQQRWRPRTCQCDAWHRVSRRPGPHSARVFRRRELYRST